MKRLTSFKYITIIVAVISLMSVVSSCCFSVRCEECEPDEMDITFEYKNYSLESFDTIIVKRFEKNKGFSTMIDSFIIQPQFDVWQQDTNFYHLIIIYKLFKDKANYTEYEKYDYQFYIPDININLSLTEMSVNFEKADPNSCCDCDRYTITGYTINNKFRYTGVTNSGYYKIIK